MKFGRDFRRPPKAFRCEERGAPASELAVLKSALGDVNTMVRGSFVLSLWYVHQSSPVCPILAVISC